MAEKKEQAEKIRETAEKTADGIKDKAEETKKEKETKEAAEVKEAKKAEETKEEKETVKEEPVEAAEDKEMRTSTENNRKKKAERREAKAARKEANKVEEKKRRPNNALIALLIFGVLVGMFAFIWGYNYYKKAESIEKYMKDTGMAEAYKNFMVDEYTTAAVKAEGNTVKVVLKVPEDAPEDTVKEYKGEDGEENLKDIGAYFLTSLKPQARGFGGEVRVLAKQGDEKLSYVRMTYREAKKYVKEAQKKAEKEAENGPEEGSEESGDDGTE